MDNIDKHRTLILAIAMMSKGLRLNAQLGIPTYVESMIFRGLNSRDDDAEVARYRATLIGDRKRVKMKFGAVTDIVFCDGIADGREVVATLKDIRDYIAREVLPSLRTFL